MAQYHESLKWICQGLVLVGIIVVLVALSYLNSESICPFIMGNWRCFDPIGIRTVELLVGTILIGGPSLVWAKLWIDTPLFEDKVIQ